MFKNNIDKYIYECIRWTLYKVNGFLVHLPCVCFAADGNEIRLKYKMRRASCYIPEIGNGFDVSLSSLRSSRSDPS